MNFEGIRIEPARNGLVVWDRGVDSMCKGDPYVFNTLDQFYEWFKDYVENDRAYEQRPRR